MYNFGKKKKGILYHKQLYLYENLLTLHYLITTYMSEMWLNVAEREWAST
jgi:hypothetical protein